MTVQHVSTPASNSIPTSLDAAANKEISAIWAQVQARIIQLAGGDTKKIKTNLSIDGVLARLDLAQEAREESSASKSKVYSTIRATFNTTLQVIQTVGEIVSQGASEVRFSCQVSVARFQERYLTAFPASRSLVLPISASMSSAT